MVLGLCDRFHVLPSQLLNEHCDLLRMLRVESYGKPTPVEEWTGE